MAVLISVQYNGSLDPLTGGDVEKVLPVLRAKAVALFERTYRLSSSTSIVHHAWVVDASNMSTRIFPDQ